jgi:hypothetical protein
MSRLIKDYPIDSYISFWCRLMADKIISLLIVFSQYPIERVDASA